MHDLKSLSIEVLSQLRVDIDAELDARAGNATTVRDRDGAYAIPTGGALLHVDLAVEDRSYVEWYPSEDAAMAALYKLAGDHRVEGRSVNFTVAGCNYSGACVEGRS